MANYDIRINVKANASAATAALSSVNKALSGLSAITKTAASPAIGGLSAAFKGVSGVANLALAPFRAITGALGDMFKIAGGIVIGRIFYKIASGIGTVASSFVEAVADVQTFQIGLEGLLAREKVQRGVYGDIATAIKHVRGEAKKYLEELQLIAVNSPYQFETVRNTFRQAMAFGFAADEARDFAEATLAMAAGIGASDDMLERMSYNLAQIRLQGKVTQLDVRQLALAGFDLVSVLQSVGKKFGVTVNDIGDFNEAVATGKIKWADFAKAYKEYAEGTFGNSSFRMSRTLKGLWSTMKDVFQVGAPRLFGLATEEFAKFGSEIVDKAMEFVQSGKLEEMSYKIRDWTKNAISSFKQFVSDMRPVVDRVRYFFEFIGRLRTFGETAITPVAMQNLFGVDYEKAKEYAEKIRKAFDRAKSIYEAGKTAISTTIDFVKQEVLPRAAALWDGLVGIYERIDWGKIRSAFETAGDIFSTAKEAVGSAAAFIAEKLNALKDSAAIKFELTFGVSASDVGAGLKDKLSSIDTETIVQKVKQAGAALSTFFATLITGVKSYVTGLVEAASGLLSGFTKHLRKIGDYLKNAFSGKEGKQFVGWLKRIGEAIARVGGLFLFVGQTILGVIWNILGAVMHNLYPVFRFIGDFVGSVLYNVFTGLIDVLRSVVAFIAGDFNNAGVLLVQGLGKIFLGLLSFITKIPDAIVSVIVTITSLFMRLFGVSQEKIDEMRNNALQNWDSFKSSLAEKMRGIADAVWNAIVKAVEWVKQLPDKATQELQRFKIVWQQKLAEVNTIVREKMAAIQGWFTQKFNAIASFMSGLGASFQSAGRNMMNSLASGIEKAANHVIEVVQRVLDNITNTLARFKINIPKIELPRLNFGGGSSSSSSSSSGSVIYGEKAVGGSVMAGRPYLVGEREPEIFFPRMSGSIVPASRLGGGQQKNVSVTINVNGAQDPDAVANAIMARLKAQGV